MQWCLKGGFGASLVSIFYPVLHFLLPPKSQAVGAISQEVQGASELEPNSGMVVPIGSQPALLVRTRDGELRAFTAVCPHLGCTVRFEPESSVIWCPCHNGAFDLHGRVIAGPPPGPLAEFKVNQRDGKVIVTKGA